MLVIFEVFWVSLLYMFFETHVFLEAFCASLRSKEVRELSIEIMCSEDDIFVI
jgi:hypothetical protein